MSATTLDRIARMSADHYRDMDEFHIAQTEGLARVLMNVIQVLRLQPDTSGETALDDAVLFGMWRASDVLAAVRRVHTYKGEGLTACGLEVVGPCPDCATANGERT